MKSFSDYIINTKVLKPNAINIKTLIGSNIKLCAVVKANAYGLGVETVCKTLFGIVDFFAVSNVSEGLGIRVFDKSTKIVVLGMTSLENLGICSQNDISISVFNHYQSPVVFSRMVYHLKNNTYQINFLCNKG